MAFYSLDSSFDVPNDAQVEAARIAGIRQWNGYLALPGGGRGLATHWTRADFDRVRRLGADPIGFCSGWDDPIAIRNMAKEWRVRPCVDAEHGIRDDHEGGDWIPGWVRQAQSGLYGLASVHYETGQPIGRGAQFCIVARYPFMISEMTTWDPAAGPRPDVPHGWQCRGTHREPWAPLSVDTAIMDDWFLTGVHGAVDQGGYVMQGGDIAAAPFKNDRLDIVVIGQDNVVRHRYADGGMGELMHYGDADYYAVDEEGHPDGGFVDVSWGWSTGPDQWRMNFKATTIEGRVYVAVIDWNGNLALSWTPLPISVLPPVPEVQITTDISVNDVLRALGEKLVAEAP